MDADKILQLKFTNSFRKGYITLKDTTLPLRFQDFQDEIEEWPVNEQDVWICSFPKTGTTWTQEMVWMITHNLDFQAGQVNLGYRSPFLELSSIFDYRDLMKENKDFQPPEFLENSLKYTKDQASPVNIKTHLPWDLLPKQIREGTKKPKIVYISRNPKDTCISYYHHCKLLEGYTGSFQEFCMLFLGGKVSFGPFWKHVLSYWQRRNEPNILFLKYEDLKTDLPSVIRKVAAFLGKNLSETQVETLKKHLSFEEMKQNKSVNYESLVEFNKKFKLVDEDGLFMRSGQIGGYKTMMTPEIIEEFDEWTRANTQGTDFSFY